MSGVDPGVSIRQDSLPALVRSVAADRDSPGEPAGLCLLSGGIVSRNLRSRLASEGIPTDAVERTTIEDLAADLVAASDRPVRVLPPPVRERSIATVLERATGRDTPLGRFADRIPTEGDVLAGVVAELDDFYRCTDAGRDREALSAVVEAVEADHPFAAETTRESVEAFGALDRRLTMLVDERNDGADDRAVLSRSHLVRAARGAVEECWEAVTGAPDWVALASVSAIDDPTLRFLLRVARETPLLVFAGPGTAGPFYRRFSAAGESIPVRRTDQGGVGEPGGTVLSAALGDKRTTAPQGVRTVAAPDTRREAEYVVRAATRTDGTSLVVAPDAGDYETPVRDVALTRNRPFRIETRRELRDLPAFRGLAATVRLLSAADAGALEPRTVLEPLRLGIRPPGDPTGPDQSTWPVEESTLRAVGSTLGDAPRSLAEFESLLVEADCPSGPVAEFLAWADDRRRSVPADGSALLALCTDLLDAHLAAVAGEDHRRLRGIAVDTTRARATAKHPAYYASRVRSELDAAASAYEWYVEVLDRPPTWETVLSAVSAGTGSETYGIPREDADAVEVVDAGNAHFRRVDHAFVVGLAAETFPRTPRRASFLHPAVRAAVHRRREQFPHLYLDGQAAQYERDVDAYAAALGVARESVTLVRPYKDDEGRDVAPSPFLDALSVPGDRHRRIGLGEWTTVGADADGDASLAEAWPALSEKERLRALAFGPDARGRDAATLRRLAEGTTDPATVERVRRRIDRFETRLEAEDD